ncbi:MAG: glycosyltransferase [Peptostreptococcaceae bacterium]|nr:glycosyltransferase [Peptostreptococcaceae bacterium]
MGSIENSRDVFENEITGNINSDDNIIFTASTGDAVLDGAEDKYRTLNNTFKKLKVPIILGVGGNEISDGGAKRFYKHFGPYYFSFIYGSSYFIFIDTTGTTAFDLQEDWLTNELIKADDYNHTFIFMDKSPLIKNKNIEFRTFLTDIFSKHKVSGVFTNGADFEENEEKGVLYYSSGGAGGLILKNSLNDNYHYIKVDVSNNQVAVEAVEVLPVSRYSILQKIESVWIFIHSVFYAQFLNVLLVLVLLLLVFFILYRKALKEVNYYRNFNSLDNKINTDRKLKIAMFTNNYLPFIGGVPISINRLAEALRKRGNKVVVFAPEYSEVNDSKDDVFRCKLLKYKKTDNFNFAIANIYSRKIVEEFKKNQFDIIHVHHPFWLGKKGLKIGKENSIPVVLTYHTRLEMYSENLPIFKLIFKNIVSHKMIRNFAQKCDGIIAPTISAKEYLENVGVSREKLVLPTGIDLDKYKNLDECDIKNIKEIYITNDEVLLCSVSRLAVEKNINFLIKGLKYVKRNSKVKFKCIIIGDGPERDNLQNLINEYSLNREVVLIGSINQNEIANYYRASDLFVFSSLSETQGMVLLEAMSGKCPVVSVKSSGTDDVIREGYNGYKTSEDIKEWAKKVIYLIENRDVLEKMGLNAFSYVEKFSLDKMAEKVERFYRKLINERGN